MREDKIRHRPWALPTPRARCKPQRRPERPPSAPPASRSRAPARLAAPPPAAGRRGAMHGRSPTRQRRYTPAQPRKLRRRLETIAPRILPASSIEATLVRAPSACCKNTAAPGHPASRSRAKFGDLVVDTAALVGLAPSRTRARRVAHEKPDRVIFDLDTRRDRLGSRSSPPPSGEDALISALKNSSRTGGKRFPYRRAARTEPAALSHAVAKRLPWPTAPRLYSPRDEQSRPRAAETCARDRRRRLLTTRACANLVGFAASADRIG